MTQQPPPLDNDARPAVGPPPLEPATPQRDRRRRWWFAVPVALFIYLFLVAVTLVQPVPVAGLSLTVPIPGVSTARLFGLPDRPFVVLVVGLDIRPEQGGPSRADTILLLRVDEGKNQASILSIPRDAMMQIPLPDGGSTRDRVNTPMVYNWSPDDPERGPAALAQTLEQNLGVKVDYYVIFDQRGAAGIIDAAGGVTVVVRRTFGQDNYSDDDINVVPQHFEKGVRHLDGYQAVAYGRIRKGPSDFDRILRQQQVAEGLVAQLSSLGNARRLPGVWDAFQDAVTTDLGFRQSAGLFVMLKQIGTDRIVTYSLGDVSVSCGSRCRGALQLLRPEETARIISEAFDDDAAGQTAAQLLVAAGVTP